MSYINFAYTDRSLNRLEYTSDEICGNHKKWWISLDGSPIPGIRFSEEELGERDVGVARELYPTLIRYLVRDNGISFEYNKKQPELMRDSGRVCLNWLLDLIRQHFRDGANKFYYAKLLIPNLEGKMPKMNKMDLAKFEPDEKKFEFGYNVVWEFFDSSIKP